MEPPPPKHGMASSRLCPAEHLSSGRSCLTVSHPLVKLSSLPLDLAYQSDLLLLDVSRARSCPRDMSGHDLLTAGMKAVISLSVVQPDDRFAMHSPCSAQGSVHWP